MLINVIVIIFIIQILESKSIDIVSIIDQSSSKSCILKMYSIIKSSNVITNITFHNLLMYEDSLTINLWKEMISLYFSNYNNINFNNKIFNPPNSLNRLRNINFERNVIYARFYLPDIFNDLNRFIYLDNDIIVNIDLNHLYNYKLVISKENESNKHKTSYSTTNDVMLSSSSINFNRRVKRNDNKIVSTIVNELAVVGMVYDRHPQHIQYIKSHFNISHPLVKKAMNSRSLEYFLNGGVILYDAHKWRLYNYTLKAEEIITTNANGSLFSSSVGDQGVFWLLLLSNVAYLPLYYNMRRLPKKTIHLLESNQQGIIHLAGLTHTNSELLCYHPISYPMLLKAVVPMYISVIISFMYSCQHCYHLFTNSCITAVDIINNHLYFNNISVGYYDVHGLFKWPPDINTSYINI